jgi:hypothetical protein
MTFAGKEWRKDPSRLTNDRHHMLGTVVVRSRAKRLCCHGPAGFPFDHIIRYGVENSRETDGLLTPWNRGEKPTDKKGFRRVAERSTCDGRNDIRMAIATT